MKDLNSIVAGNLKRIRNEMKLSLEKLSELTGVSKAMLRQIETGESSPTINTIWKIAAGLKIPYTNIITAPKPETVVIYGSEIKSQVDDEGRYNVYSIFPSEDGRRFDVFTIELKKDCSFYSSSHADRTEELITVYEGVLTLHIGDDEYIINTGDAIKFRADTSHSYHNTSDGLTRINMVIYYPL